MHGMLSSPVDKVIFIYLLGMLAYNSQDSFTLMAKSVCYTKIIVGYNTDEAAVYT